MPEPDDDLRALRAADPLDPASVPSATDALARALFERITMTDTQTAPAPVPQPPKRTRRLLLPAVAAAAVVLAVGAVALSGDDDPSSPPETSAPSGDEIAGGPIDPGGTTLSCVEVYDLETLAAREFAFAGTVVAVDEDLVTFAVDEWYRGGDGSEITLGGALGLSSFSSAGGTTELELGTRMLVAGDGGFAWSCGFTQPYDEAVAGQWAEALAG